MEIRIHIIEETGTKVLAIDLMDGNKIVERILVEYEPDCVQELFTYLKKTSPRA